MNAVIKSQSKTALEPVTLQEAIAFAEMLSRSTMIPREFQNKPENVIVAIQWGREIGLGPLQALQNIAVINGRPSVWGDAMLALVRGSGICAYVREGIDGTGDSMVATCCAARVGEEASEVKVTFSVTDAKKAGLWSKAGPWTQYPKRMLQLRARGFALRDCFPDVLRGVISTEEAQDIPSDDAGSHRVTIDGKPDSVKTLLRAINQQNIETAPVDPDVVVVAPDASTVPSAQVGDDGVAPSSPADPKVADVATIQPPVAHDAPYLDRATAALSVGWQDPRWMKTLRKVLTACPTIKDLSAVQNLPSVKSAMTDAPPATRSEVAWLFKTDAERLATADDDDTFPGDKP